MFLGHMEMLFNIIFESFVNKKCNAIWYSCNSACDPELSCDWTACYDDIEFARAVIKDVSQKYCIDLDSVHMSGLSNGGMFQYFAGRIVLENIFTSAKQYWFLIQRGLVYISHDLQLHI